MDYLTSSNLNREQLTRYYNLRVSEAETVQELKPLVGLVNNDRRLPNSRREAITQFIEKKIDSLIDREKQLLHHPYDD